MFNDDFKNLAELVAKMYGADFAVQEDGSFIMREKKPPVEKSPEEKREEWVSKMFILYQQDLSVIAHFHNRYTVLMNDIANVVAISACSPHDNFVSEVGIAVAYAHYIGEPIPDFV